jgi:predicted TIM-barrel fold metal-dependent hydrolase
MIDDIFVFDCVIHVYDMSDRNTHSDRRSQIGRQSLLKIGSGMRWSGYADQGLRFDKRWSVEEIYEMVFLDAPTDMAMAQVVPIFDWFDDYFAPVEAQHAMATRYPDRVLFCGGTDPLHEGLDRALEQIDFQVGELGARSMKFYNGHDGASWRCDDPDLAYPLYERCGESGIEVIQFHKGQPFGLQPLEALSPLDLQAAARDFPDLKFVIHHLAFPYFNEVVSVAARFPNVYLALSGNLNLSITRPRLVQEQLGRLLMEVGVEKLIWGSEAALAGGPAPYLRAFMELEIPEDLRSGYGYPQLTADDRERILGRNFAELMGIDVDARRDALAALPR